MPLSSVGTVQRATKAPITMPMEMMKGENPGVDQLGGRFGGAQPDGRGKSAKYAEFVQGER